MTQLLVIGGTGFIGHHLLRLVVEKKWIVTSLSLTLPKTERCCTTRNVSQSCQTFSNEYLVWVYGFQACDSADSESLQVARLLRGDPEAY